MWFVVPGLFIYFTGDVGVFFFFFPSTTFAHTHSLTPYIIFALGLIDIWNLGTGD